MIVGGSLWASTIGTEIAEWLKQIRVSWLGELRHPLALGYPRLL